MAKTIWKYELPVEDSFSLDLPVSAEILSLDVQYGRPTLWCLVDLELHEVKERTFRFFGTGQTLKENFNELKFVGTVLLRSDTLVFHLFEEI